MARTKTARRPRSDKTGAPKTAPLKSDEAYRAMTQMTARQIPPIRSMTGLLGAYAETPAFKAVLDRLSWGAAMVPFGLVGIRDIATGQFLQDPTLQYGSLEDRQARWKEIKAPNSGLKLIQQTDRHPALQVINGGNRLMIGLSVRQLTQVYLDILGEAYWIKSRDALGIVREVWPLPPHWIRPGDGLPTYDRPTYEIQWYSVRLSIPQNEVIRFFHPDPRNPYGRGIGTGMSLTDEIDADEFQSKYITSEYYNGGRPSLLITAEGLSDPETDRIEEKWSANHQGVLKQHLPMFLNRKVEVNELSRDMAGMQAVDLRKFNREEFEQTYGVPPELMGKLVNSSRNAMGTSDYVNAKYNTTPRMELLRATLQRDLVEEYDPNAVLIYKNPIADDNQFHLTAGQYAPWALEINEWRAMMGAPFKPEVAGLHYIPSKARFGPLTSAPPVAEPAPTPVPAPVAEPAPAVAP